MNISQIVVHNQGFDLQKVKDTQKWRVWTCCTRKHQNTPKNSPDENNNQQNIYTKCLFRKWLDNARWSLVISEACINVCINSAPMFAVTYSWYVVGYRYIVHTSQLNQLYLHLKLSKLCTITSPNTMWKHYLKCIIVFSSQLFIKQCRGTMTDCVTSNVIGCVKFDVMGRPCNWLHQFD